MARALLVVGLVVIAVALLAFQLTGGAEAMGTGATEAGGDGAGSMRNLGMGLFVLVCLVVMWRSLDLG